MNATRTQKTVWNINNEFGAGVQLEPVKGTSGNRLLIKDTSRGSALVLEDHVEELRDFLIEQTAPGGVFHQE